MLQASRRRQVGIAAATLAAIAAVWVQLQFVPNGARGIYIAMALALAMSFCTLLAWRAGRRERNAGCYAVAAAFATYPLLVTVYLLSGA